VPASQEQKVDFLLKKIGYSASKTGIAEDESTISTGSNTAKKPFEEGIPSPLIIPSTSILADSSFIPTTPPGSDTAYVKVYSTSSALRMTRDSTVGTNTRSYIAYTTYNDTSSARLTNWIDTQFGASYIIKVYKGDPNSSGVELQQAGANATTDGWFFDYSSGILNFNGTNLPAGIDATNIYIVGYRYIGATGIQPPAGIGTFRDLYVSGVSTFMGSIHANSHLRVSGISTFNGLIDANGLIEATAGQNKIPSLYSNYSDLPNAGTYHGMFAHVHATGRGYYAHAGNWMELVNKEVNGTVGTGTERYDIGYLDATNLYVSGITTLGSIGISTGLISGPAVTYIDPATVGDNTGTLVVKGNLQVEGTQTTVNSSTMTVTDVNIELAKGAANDAAADTGGITVKSGDGDKTWQWLDATDSWTSSEHIRISDDKVFGFASDTNTYIGRPAADTIAFTHGGSERVRIMSGGAIGINTTTGTNTVSIGGAEGLGVKFHNFTSGNMTYITVQPGDNVASNVGGSGYFTWHTGGNEKVRFANNGTVGIGTILPTSNLHVANYSGDATIEIESGSTASSILRFGDVDNNDVGQIKYDHSDNSLGLYTSNTNERVRIDSSGNTNIVGILTASNFDYTTNDNIRIGAGAAHTTTAQKIIAIGEGALQNVTTNGIVALGYNAGNSQTSGSDNIYIGNYAGEKNVDKNANTFVGDISGQYVTSHSNTAVGFAALRNVNGGSQATHGNNSAFGRDSMQQITTGSNNAAFGNGSLMYVATGQANSAFGYESLKNCTGQYNTGVGRLVGTGLTTGQKNTILGAWFTGNQLTTGSNNTLLGYNATPTSTTVNNEITLGDTNVTKFRIPGIGVTFSDDIVILPAPIDASGDLTVGGNFKVVGVSTFSDDVTFTTANSKNIVFDKDANDLTFGDSVILRFGDSNDLNIYHDSTSSNIADSFGGLNIKSNVLTLRASDNSRYIEALNASHVKLFYAGNEKLATSGVGVTVTGLTETDTLNSGNATFTGTISAGSTTGTDGYYLKTTGIGVTWAAFPSSRTTDTQIATAGQTSFNFSYNVGFVDVFVNGVKLPTSEFTASNGSTIVLDDAAFENDTLEFISLNTLPVTSGGGASNLNGLSDVTITGSPVVGETLQHNGSEFVNDYTVTATTTSTSQTAILSLPVATYRSAEYTIQVTEGTKYHVTKVLAIHDGTNVNFNEYGTLTTSTSLSTFALDVSSGNMRLLATPASTNSTAFKVKFTAIKV